MHELSEEEIELRQQARGDLIIEADGAYTLALDPSIDEELRLEGLARELVNRIQRLRRDSGLEVADRIRLSVAAGPDLEPAVEQFRDYIMAETLASELVRADVVEAGTDVDLDGVTARIAIAVATRD